jgi:hypothetical protein
VGRGMTNEDDREGPLAAEASYLLALTHNFSESFKIKRDRVTNWRLMGFVMDLEKDGIIDPDELCDKIEALVPAHIKKKIEEKKKRGFQSWLDKFVRQFGNDDGQFLDVLRTTDVGLPSSRKEGAASEEGSIRFRSENVRKFKLNANFLKCAKDYVSGLKDVHEHDFSILRESNISDDQGRRVVKEIFKFQTSEYWPRYVSLVGELAAVVRGHERPDAGLDEKKFQILHFILLLMFWRLKPGASWDESDINTKTADVLKIHTASDLLKTVHFFGKKNGCQILLVKKQKEKAKKKSKTDRYEFNTDYDEPVIKYLTESVAIRPQWRASVITALSGPI